MTQRTSETDDPRLAENERRVERLRQDLPDTPGLTVDDPETRPITETDDDYDYDDFDQAPG